MSEACLLITKQCHCRKGHFIFKMTEFVIGIENMTKGGEKTWPHIDVTNTRFHTEYTCMLVHICSRRV